DRNGGNDGCGCMVPLRRNAWPGRLTLVRAYAVPRSSSSAVAALLLSRNSDAESTDRETSGSRPAPTAATPAGLRSLTIGMRPVVFDQRGSVHLAKLKPPSGSFRVLA